MPQENITLNRFATTNACFYFQPPCNARHFKRDSFHSKQNFNVYFVIETTFSFRTIQLEESRFIAKETLHFLSELTFESFQERLVIPFVLSTWDFVAATGTSKTYEVSNLVFHLP